MKSKSSYPAQVFLSLVSLFFLTACQMTPLPPPEKLTATAIIPVVTALPETKEAQEKGGVELSVVPVTYVAEKIEKTTTRQITPSIGGIMMVSLATGGNSANQIYVQQVTEQKLQTNPKRLMFTVRVNNKLPRVFRGQGAVVQFNVAGKMQNFGDTDYKEIIECIVPPRNETEVRIRGPLLDTLPDKCTIGIFLYDVVTATDLAGNVTEKQNYEWYFSYEAKKVEESVERKVSEGFVDVATFQALLMKEQQEKMLQNVMPPRQ